MLPLLLLLFLLIQSLSAAEFPDLTKNIRMAWNETEVTRSLDGSRTVSYGNQVPYFILCGKFDAQRKDSYCQIQYYSERKTSMSWSKTTGNTFGKAQFISQDNSSGYEYSCMRFENPIRYFPTYYYGEASGQTHWSVTYFCPVSSPWPWIIGCVVVFLVVFLGAMGFGMYRRKKKRELERQQQQKNEYVSYTTDR